MRYDNSRSVVYNKHTRSYVRGWVNLRSERFNIPCLSPGSHAYPMPMEAPKEERGTGTAHNSTYVLGASGRRLGFLGAAARLVTTWPLALVGLGARHIRAIRYAIFRQALKRVLGKDTLWGCDPRCPGGLMKPSRAPPFRYPEP